MRRTYSCNRPTRCAEQPEPKQAIREPSRGIRSQQEVGDILGVTKMAVAFGERSALRKLAKSPVMRRLAEECGIVGE